MNILLLTTPFLLACWLSVPTAAQVVVPGRCPAMSVVTDFQASRYLGKWYEAEKYFAIFQLGGKCVTAEYTDEGNGVVGVFNKQINSIDGGVSEIEGTATLVGEPGEAKLSVVFPSTPLPAPYWVVDTDYDNYAVVWSCTNFAVFHTVNAWILTREQNPQGSTLDKAYEAVDKNNINRDLFLRTDQEDCNN